jgi:hypothetical protein
MNPHAQSKDPYTSSVPRPLQEFSPHSQDRHFAHCFLDGYRSRWGRLMPTDRKNDPGGRRWRQELPFGCVIALMTSVALASPRAVSVYEELLFPATSLDRLLRYLEKFVAS